MPGNLTTLKFAWLCYGLGMFTKWRTGLLLLVFLLVFIAMAATWSLWQAAPTGNTTQTKFDVILVLGVPTLKNGSASPGQRARVLEGVEEWRRGVAPRVIVSGTAAHNKWVEADTMAQLARSWGVPSEDVIEEPQALNTIQNVYYTWAIMQAHGWKSAEVITTTDHLPRAGRILARFPLVWRTKAAPWPKEYGVLNHLWHNSMEAFYTLRLMIFGFPHSRFMPQ